MASTHPSTNTTTNTTASPFVSNYDRMTGNSTRNLARSMINLVTSPSSLAHASYTPRPISDSSTVLDNACGPGIVLSALKALYPDTAFNATAADLNAGMLAQVASLTSSNRELWGNTPVEILEQDVRNLDKLADNSFSHVFTSLGLLVPGDEDHGALKACQEMYRVLAPSNSAGAGVGGGGGGGVAVVSTWADRVFPPAFERAFQRLRPASEQPSNRMGIAPKHLSGAWLMETMAAAGFGQNVLVVPVVTFTEAGSMKELTENMGLAKGMFWTGCEKWSKEEMEKAIQMLGEELRALRTFEEVDDGSVRIGMRTWVALGWKDSLGEEASPC